VTAAGFSSVAPAITTKFSPEHMKTILSFGMGVESSAHSGAQTSENRW
jgi:hypothetical protein